MSNFRNFSGRFGDDLQTCPDAAKPGGNETETGDDGWVNIATVPGSIEYEIVAGLLQMAGIPVISKTQCIDGFMQMIAGAPIKGIDILVPMDRHEEAVQLLNAPCEEADFAGSGHDASETPE